MEGTSEPDLARGGPKPSFNLLWGTKRRRGIAKNALLLSMVRVVQLDAFRERVLRTLRR